MTLIASSNLDKTVMDHIAEAIFPPCIFAIFVFTALVLYQRYLSPYAPLFRKASTLHAKAWGKEWPQHQNAISKTEIVPINFKTDIAVDEDTYMYPGHYADIPAKLDYTCLQDIGEVAQLFDAESLGKILIVREEYHLLRKVLENKPGRGFVITGQPGTGKTTFLYWLLLYRLQRKLPTAIEHKAGCYIIFDERGVLVKSLNLPDDRLNKCWALTNMSLPCVSFVLDAQRVIQASFPKRDRWKGWLKQVEGTCIYSDLPSVMEIGAILKDSNLEPSQTLSLVGQWGPSIQTIMAIARRTTSLDDLKADAESSALELCNNLMILEERTVPNRDGPTVIFLRPHRIIEDGETVYDICRPFIPTKFLGDILESHRCAMSSQDSVLARSSFSSWYVEQEIHKLISSSRNALRLLTEEKSSSEDKIEKWMEEE